MNPFLLLAATLTLGAEPPRTTLEARAQVPADHDGCLDHAVRELGMSAKRVEGQRRWNIGPQFLHPSVVEGGALRVTFEKGEGATAVLVTASWPGAVKDPDTQTELESRLGAMARKLAQVCGVTEPVVACTVTPAGAAGRGCTGR